jgi:hypothetical protein
MCTNGKLCDTARDKLNTDRATMTDYDFEELSRRAKQAVQREQTEARVADAPP